MRRFENLSMNHCANRQGHETVGRSNEYMTIGDGLETRPMRRRPQIERWELQEALEEAEL